MVTAGQQRRERKSEAQLALALTCMTNLLSSGGERVYFKDRLSRFLLVSEGWIAAYAPGWTAEELIGKTDFDVFSEPHASAAFADEQTIIRTGEPVVGKVELETFGARPDAWVSTTKMPLRDSGGEIIGTFGISRDVTPQIRAEQALAELAAQLSVRSERLRELDEMKDEFIGLVSHELRTPLTSIIGYANLLRDKRTSGPDAKEYAEVIQRNSQRLLRLVEDLLLLSQTHTGTMAVELRSADLAQIAVGAVEEMRQEAERRNIGLSLHATAAPRPPVDNARIAQLLGNLISNAVKFTAPGGQVEVTVGAEGGEAVIAVADTGIGISAADRKEIFERFFRSAAATRQMIPGTGLGLTIARHIVAAHNGAITVESEEGRGSTFTVRLPLRLPEPPCTAAGPGEQKQCSPAAGCY
jgi:two-component system, sensor histidine kinase and response regulator